jgi:aminopeptidase-like protein
VPRLDPTAFPPAAEAGEDMHRLMAELYPICRSLSGDGVRATYDVIGREAPLERSEVPSGSEVFDWTLPREWNIRGAWIDGPGGERVVDFADSNLHVLGYSAPVRERLSLDELRPHLYSDPEHPDRIPFRTSYHHENWGFCLRHETLEGLPEGEYEVCIDSTLEPGALTLAECRVDGETQDEIVVSTYADHPSLCNDNLSGVVLVAALAKHVSKLRPRHTFRFLFGPATLGPLIWLQHNEDRLDRVKHGLVASCCGDPGPLTYKRSRKGVADVDRAAEHVLRHRGVDHEVRPFSPLGGDERQFCSPGFDLPFGCLTRTPADEFDGYHSSADDLELVRPAALGDSFATYVEVLSVLEGNETLVNLSPKGEPQLGKRGLYRTVGGGSFTEGPLLWVLNLADGSNDLLGIAQRADLPFSVVREAADTLVEARLLSASAT